MKHCLECQKDFSSESWQCPQCEWKPEVIENIIHFAPALSEENDGFHAESFKALAQNESQNFWFQARNTLIAYMIDKYCEKPNNFMEIGCGTGFVLQGVHQAFPDVKLTGTEIYAQGLTFAQKRIKHDVDFYQMDGRKVPFSSAFDLIGAFDCLEHIDEDEQTIAEIYRALKPEGCVILTVPQHPFMWSQEDDHACHKRRYKTHELQDKLVHAGFSIVNTTSFVTLLFPLMVATRFYRKFFPNKEEDNISDGLHISPFMNTLLRAVMAVEHSFIKMGLRLPFGGSRLVIAQKERC